MGFKGFSLKLFNADNKAAPAGRSDLQKKVASENEPRESMVVVANGPSDELASNAKSERSNGRTEPNRRSPRKREDRTAFDADNADAEIMRGPDPSPDMSTMDKPVLKLFLKSGEGIAKVDTFSSPSSSYSNEKKEAPTLLRLRIGSSEEKLPKQVAAALLIEDQAPLPEPNRPITPVKGSRKYKKKQESAEEPVVRQKRAYKKSSEAKEEPKDIFTEPQGKKVKKEKPVKVKKEKKQKSPKKKREAKEASKEKKTRRSKKQRLAEEAGATQEVSQVVEEEHPQEKAAEMVPESAAGDIVNEDFCAACKNTGYFICCETCPNSFHLACVFPPLASVPEESWQCIDCLKSHPARLNQEIADAQAIVSSPNEIENYRAMWDRVWALTILSEPTAFSLPKRLRPKKDLPFSLELLDESAYQVQPKRRSYVADARKNSSAGISGTRRSTSNRSSGTAPPPSLSRRITEHGQCHHCGQRSVIPDLLPLRAEPIVPKPLLRCDGCPLLWHMDCLDPPLTVLPSAEKRWLCPAHVKLPMYPNFIPEVDLEDNDPFAYEMITRLGALPPPPTERVRLSESSIRLDFGAKARRLREESKLNPLVPPPEVISSYAALTEVPL